MCNAIIKGCQKVSGNKMLVFKVFVQDDWPTKILSPYKDHCPFFTNLTPKTVATKRASTHGYSSFFYLRDAKRYATDLGMNRYSIWSFSLPMYKFNIGEVCIENYGKLLVAMSRTLTNPKLVGTVGKGRMGLKRDCWNRGR